MNAQELKDRTKEFALRVMRLVDALPNTPKGRAVAGQLVRSGTSVAANYRSACRSRSQAEFISKIGVVEEEADETALWLELIIDDKILPEPKIAPLLRKQTSSPPLWQPRTSPRRAANTTARQT